MFFELEAYTLEEEGTQSSVSVCVGVSRATSRPISVEVVTVDGTALGKSCKYLLASSRGFVESLWKSLSILYLMLRI